MNIIMIAGLWLEASAWDDVASELERLGHRPHPLALPGVDDRSATATLDDQIDAVVAAVDATDRPMVVGHSAACGLAWIAADRRPDAVAHSVLIGGMPVADGATYADFFEAVDGRIGFPGWEPFEGPDSDDLDDGTKARIADAAVPVLEAVSKGVVHLGDERRYDVPVTLVCPEFTPDDAKAWVAAGHVPEIPTARQVSFVDIDSGHWPMFSRPAELARALDSIATTT